MVPSRQYSSKDLPGHTMLHSRKAYQGSKEDLKTVDYKSKLLESEYRAKLDKMKAENKGAPLDERDIPTMKAIGSSYRQVIAGGGHQAEPSSNFEAADTSGKPQDDARLGKRLAYQDEDDDDFIDDDENAKPEKSKPAAHPISDKRESADNEQDDNDEDDQENDDDDDEDEMEMLLEYERIRKEREEKERKEKEAKYENLTTEEQDEIIKGNPLYDNSYSLNKRWYEETVFRNQAKTEPKAKKRSINDTVRSDFHKKFLKKYIWT